MKFRSPTEKPVYLGLTSGHTFVVTPEFIDVPMMFRKAAIAAECLTEGEAAAASPERGPALMDMIVAQVRKMVADANPADFTNDGRPNATQLSARCGFTVLAGQRDEAWAIVSDDA